MTKYTSDDFAKIFETVFGYAPFADLLNPVEATKNAFKVNPNSFTINSDVNEYVSEQERYHRQLNEAQARYDRERNDYEDAVRDEQDQYERAMYERELEYDLRTTAVELAIAALGDNSIHAGEPVATATEILKFLQGDLN